MKIFSKIKKYRKSFGFSLISIGGVTSALAISMFLGGGMHGVGVPNGTKNDGSVAWSRVQMGFVNFQKDGIIVEQLKAVHLINPSDESVTFNDLHNITKNKLNRIILRAQINTRQKTLENSDYKGSDGVGKQLALRSQIDIRENLLSVDSMYNLSIVGVAIMPIGLIILVTGLYLWYSGIAKDKKQAKLFLENLNKTAPIGRK